MINQKVDFKLIKDFSKLEAKKDILPFEKKLNENGFYFIEKAEEYELIQKEPESIVFIIGCDSSEDLKEQLIKECNYHLEMIETEDEDYFDDCDKAYLKGDWKNLVLKIKEIVQ